MEPYVATERRDYKSAEYRRPVQTKYGDLLTTPPRPVWIDDLFEIVMQAVSDGDNVSVSYDVRFGYPTMVDIKRDDKGTDADDRYEIRDLEVLEYN